MKNSLLYVAEVKLKSFLIMPFKYTERTEEILQL